MSEQLTSRQTSVLAVLAAKPGARFAPVQIQKLFFLIDENVASEIGGKLFNFEPYDYGPFDKQVYSELEALAQLGLVVIENRQYGAQRRYSLSDRGQELGQEKLSALQPDLGRYFQEVSDWVRSLSFSELVGAIYNAFPAMKANSIFKS